MNKEQLISYLSNKKPNYIDGTGLYMISEYLKEKSVDFPAELLKALPSMCSQADTQDLFSGMGGKQKNTRRLLAGIEKVEAHYTEKFNVNPIFDKDGKFVKYV